MGQLRRSRRHDFDENQMRDCGVLSLVAIGGESKCGYLKLALANRLRASISPSRYYCPRRASGTHPQGERGRFRALLATAQKEPLRLAKKGRILAASFCGSTGPWRATSTILVRGLLPYDECERCARRPWGRLPTHAARRQPPRDDKPAANRVSTLTFAAVEACGEDAERGAFSRVFTTDYPHGRAGRRGYRVAHRSAVRYLLSGCVRRARRNSG